MHSFRSIGVALDCGPWLTAFGATKDAGMKMAPFQSSAILSRNVPSSIRVIGEAEELANRIQGWPCQSRCTTSGEASTRYGQ